MDNTEEYGNAGEHGQKTRLIQQWVKRWTTLWLNMYCGHCLSNCYYMYISLHPPSKSSTVFFLGKVVGRGIQLLLDLLQEQNDISSHSAPIIERHMIESEKCVKL